MSAPWETPPTTTDGRPAQPLGVFVLRTFGEIVGVAAACAFILACVWTYMLIR